MTDIENEIAENAPATDSSAQRAELHKTIWKIANDLRGSVDGWDFKSYVLNMLFYRFVSENLTAYLNAEDADLDYANLSDEDAEYGRAGVVQDKGFFIPPSQLFENVQAGAHNNPNLNETIEKVFRNIESSAFGTESEDDFKGLFDDFQVNSTKLGATVAERNKKLAQLFDAVAALPLGSFEDNSIDLFGDAYEFLMQMYASNAGKSGGEFFTPQEVSELLARIAVSGKEKVRQVYDPACGSGSLLLKFAKVLGKENVGGFYGQEINITTYNLARMNMFLHDIGFESFDIQRGDTLINPLHDDIEPFDAIVSNPPYSIRWEGADNPVLINDERYSPAGVLAPKSKADLAFTMHMLSYLDVDGTAAIVEFPGAMYRGGAEKKIREYLVKNNFVQAVIQLPTDLFFGTPIATCILVLKKSKEDDSILFVDASKHFKRVGKNNKLFPEHQDAILKLYEDREDADYEAALVTNEDVLANDSNLSVNSYVEKEDVREVIDVKALNEELRQIVSRQEVLRQSIDEIVADLEGEIAGREKQFTTVCQTLLDTHVPTVNLEEIAELGTGSRNTSDAVPGGDYAFYTRGEEILALDEYDFDDTSIVTAGDGVGVGKTMHLVNGKYALHQRAYRIHLVDENYSTRFVCYLMKQNFLAYMRKNSVHASVTSVRKWMLESFPVPALALEVQEEIATKLDNFTECIDNLKRECELRQKQYEYYRDQLLDFKVKE